MFGGLFLAWVLLYYLWARRAGACFTTSVLLAGFSFALLGSTTSGDVNDNRAMFMLLGTMRLIIDVRINNFGVNPMTAIRDYATVYYASFYFLAFNICKHQPSRASMLKFITVSLAVLIPVYLVLWAFPQILDHIMVRGVPLLLPRSDLTGSFMGFACILFFLLGENSAHKPFWMVLSGLSLCVVLLAMSRATFVAFAAGVALLIICRRTAIVKYLIVFLVAGGIMLTISGLAARGGGEENFTTRLADKAESILDITSGRRYESAVGDISAANNRFRTIWWMTVIDETMEVGYRCGRW